MNKSEIIKVLEAFPYSVKDYWVITGGAMVLHGIKDSTSDIDLGCNSSMADELMRDGFFVRLTESGNRQFKYGEHIEIFENWLNDSVTSVDGLPVISLKGLIEMKRELGRDKDFKDISLIEEYLAGKGAISAQ